MTKPTLTLENWNDELYKLLGSFGHANNSSMTTLIQMFCQELLTLQKEEAIRRIEEEKNQDGVGDGTNRGMSIAQNIIRNL